MIRNEYAYFLSAHVQPEKLPANTDYITLLNEFAEHFGLSFADRTDKSGTVTLEYDCEKSGGSIIEIPPDELKEKLSITTDILPGTRLELQAQWLDGLAEYAGTEYALYSQDGHTATVCPIVIQQPCPFDDSPPKHYTIECSLTANQANMLKQFAKQAGIEIPEI